LRVGLYVTYNVVRTGQYFPAINKTSWSEHSRMHITLTSTNVNFCHSKPACQRTEYRFDTMQLLASIGFLVYGHFGSGITSFHSHI